MTSAQKIGNWSVAAIPSGWEIVPEFGLRRSGKDLFPSNVVLTEEKLPEEMSLGRYVENQMEIMLRLLPEPKILGPDRASLFGSDDTQTVRISYKSTEGRSVVQTQIYTHSQGLVGIATFTTVEEELVQVGETFKLVGKGLRFAEDVGNQ